VILLCLAVGGRWNVAVCRDVYYEIRMDQGDADYMDVLDVPRKSAHVPAVPGNTAGYYPAPLHPAPAPNYVSHEKLVAPYSPAPPANVYYPSTPAPVYATPKTIYPAATIPSYQTTYAPHGASYPEVYTTTSSSYTTSGASYPVVTTHPTYGDVEEINIEKGKNQAQHRPNAKDNYGATSPEVAQVTQPPKKYRKRKGASKKVKPAKKTVTTTVGYPDEDEDCPCIEIYYEALQEYSIPQPRTEPRKRPRKTTTTQQPEYYPDQECDCSSS